MACALGFYRLGIAILDLGLVLSDKSEVVSEVPGWSHFKRRFGSIRPVPLLGSP